jgi:hypothetical protein
MDAKLKPSAIDVLRFIRRNGWTRNRTIINRCPTNSATKRVSELSLAKKIITRRCPDDPRFVEHRARRT